MKIRRMKSKTYLRTMIVMLWMQSLSAVFLMGSGRLWASLFVVFLMSISFTHLIQWAGKIVDMMPQDTTRTDHNKLPAQSDRLDVSSQRAIERNQK